MYVQKVSISQLRSFRKAEIDFCHPGVGDEPEIPNVTLLLGDNGAGKTSILRAVALAALAPVIGSSGFRPYKLVRSTHDEAPDQATVRGEFVLHAQDTGSKNRKESLPVSTETRIVRRGDVEQVSARERKEAFWDNIFQDRSPAFLVVGYGASRRVENAASFDGAARAKSRHVRYERVSGLFEEGVTLTPLGAWLPEFRRTNPGRYRQVVTLIDRLLPEGTRIGGEVEAGEYVFEHQGSSLPFAAMSDGYRAYIGWVADLLYHVCMGAPSGYRLEENRGIVLVDEVDLHLHPAWQREVVPRLARALPNLQFVLTTHSPLVAGTLRSTNLRLIEADESGASVVRRLHEHVHGLSADQILLSSYFGLKSPRAPDAVETLRELAVDAQEGDDEAAWAFLRRLSASTFTDEERAAIHGGTPRNGAGAASPPSGASGGGSRAASSKPAPTPTLTRTISKSSSSGAKTVKAAVSAARSSASAASKGRSKAAGSKPAASGAKTSKAAASGSAAARSMKSRASGAAKSGGSKTSTGRSGGGSGGAKSGGRGGASSSAKSGGRPGPGGGRSGGAAPKGASGGSSASGGGASGPGGGASSKGRGGAGQTKR